MFERLFCETVVRIVVCKVCADASSCRVSLDPVLDRDELPGCLCEVALPNRETVARTSVVLRPHFFDDAVSEF